MLNKINWKVFFVSITVVFLTALAGSFFTSRGVDTQWYQDIKPSITPPNYVFPIVWNILFLMIALSLYFAWISTEKEKKKLASVFGLNFLINISWSAFYFGLINPLAAFFILIALFLSIILLISYTYRINKLSAYLLIPYLLWVGFAGILNYLSIGI